MKRLLITPPMILLLAALAFGQAAPPPKAEKGKAAPAPAAQPVVTDTITAYLIPDAPKLKIRDYEHESDQLEIENQQMLVKIEKNKARQAVLLDGIKLEAMHFAQSQKIDLDQYELELGAAKFVIKKKATK
jgi:hypothetical protein